MVRARTSVIILKRSREVLALNFPQFKKNSRLIPVFGQIPATFMGFAIELFVLRSYELLLSRKIRGRGLENL
jgi:hypothetical protein